MKSFSFAAHARDFDQHIEASIPGLQQLRSMSVGLSRRFIQNGTTVIDIGCSTGALLSSIRSANQLARPFACYVGIDAEAAFSRNWRERRGANISFCIGDARSFDGFDNLSLVTSLFTLQFVPERDKPALLRRIYNGLLDGGALIVAEKVLANSARFQDLLTFGYYDAKLQQFTEKEILDKERSLRGQMFLWSNPELGTALCNAGFRPEDIQSFWQNYLFVGTLAVKRECCDDERDVRHCATPFIDQLGGTEPEPGRAREFVPRI
jgi:tRNA (cmo5U34)-methyltransferase